MIFHSIRWRVQVWHGLILVIVLAGFGFTAHHVSQENQLRRVDQELEQSLMGLFRSQLQDRPPGPPSDRDPERRFPDFAGMISRLSDTIRQAGASDSTQTNGIYFVLWRSDGSVLARSLSAPPDISFPSDMPTQDPRGFFELGRSNSSPALPAGGRATVGTSTNPAGGGLGGPPMASMARTRGQYREVCHPVPFGGVVLAGRSLASDNAAMRRLALWLLIAGAAVLLLGLAGGWWVASRAIAPVDEISATALKISGGDLSQRISVAHTENELGRLAEILNSTFARLEAAFAHQARFTADASHELRTPLAVILTQTQNALSRERSGGEYRETLEACLRSAQRMRRLTESLLQLARLDAGQEPMKRERFDLAVVTLDSAELVRPLAAERKIEIRCDLPPLECMGDPERIGQVVTNLLTNSIQYNRDYGEVRISGKTENGAVLLEVADTGEGLPSDAIPHIFERFYRVDASRSGNAGGTGLGLAICKAILDAHSGTVEVASRVGAGSTFTVRLPRD